MIVPLVQDIKCLQVFAGVDNFHAMCEDSPSFYLSLLPHSLSTFFPSLSHCPLKGIGSCLS